MSTVSWQRIKAILEAVLEVGAEKQTTVLERHCGDDEELRSQVETFLLSRGKLSEGFLDQPLWSPDPSRLEPDRRGGVLRETREATQEHPKRVGPYRLLQQVGHGGMGAVYRAVRESDYDQQVAIKFVDPSKVGRFASDDHRARFERERQILAYLDHPHIAHLLDGGTTDDGRPYFVMEYVEGEPIDSYCDNRQLGIRQRLELFLKVCSAVEAAHRSLIVHRDLKPGNILVTRDGEPKLLDFGIAKQLDPTEASLTVPGAIPMTPRYASPEQVSGAPITTSSDVYALGVLLYQLLCGRPPYEVDTQSLYHLSRVICETTPLLPSRAVTQVPPRSGQSAQDPSNPGTGPVLSAEVIGRLRATSSKRLRRYLSGDLDAIVLKALRKQPKNRYGSVALLADDIRNYLEGLPVRAHHSTWTYRLGKFARRQKLVTTLAALLFVLLFVLAVLLSANQKMREKDSKLFELMTHLFTDSGAALEGEELVSRMDSYLPELESLPAERAMRSQFLGLALQTLGRDRQAQTMYEITIEAEDQALAGKGHEAWVQYMTRFGRLYYGERYYYPAGKYFSKLESSWEREGIKSCERVANLVDLGSTLKLQNELEAARRRYEKALELADSLPTHCDRQKVRIHYNFASLAFNRGDLEEAEARAQEAWALSATVEEEPVLEVNILGLLGRTQDLLDRSEAEATLRENLRRRLLLADATEDDDAARKVALAQGDLADFLLKRGRIEEGEGLLQQALRELSLNPDDYVLDETEALRGYVAAARGDHVAAAVYFLQGYRATCRGKGGDNLQVAQSALRVAEAYARLGLASQAADYRQMVATRSCAGYLNRR